jgi:hypothetical protein
LAFVIRRTAPECRRGLIIWSTFNRENDMTKDHYAVFWAGRLNHERLIRPDRFQHRCVVSAIRHRKEDGPRSCVVRMNAA